VGVEDGPSIPGVKNGCVGAEVWGITGTAGTPDAIHRISSI
jgi:hypothetical protein